MSVLSVQSRILPDLAMFQTSVLSLDRSLGISTEAARRAYATGFAFGRSGTGLNDDGVVHADTPSSTS